jgi:hypothetical protein
MRMLQFVETPRYHHAKVLQLAMRLFRDRSESIAVRVFAMTVLGNLCDMYADLKNELVPLIEDELPIATPAFRSRGLKILKSLTTQGGRL